MKNNEAFVITVMWLSTAVLGFLNPGVGMFMAIMAVVCTLYILDY